MRVLFVDDHALVRESLCPFLLKLSDTVEVIQAGSLAEGLSLARDKIDLVLLDLQLPGCKGLDGVVAMKAAVGQTPIVILSAFSDRRTVNAAFDLGIAGFVPKSASGRTLTRALQGVLEGERYIPSSFLEEDASPSIFDRGARAGGQMHNESALSALTSRESDSLRLLITGRSNKEIARELSLQEITVKFHLRNAYKKIGAANRADAVRIAYQNNWQGAL